MSGRCDQGRRRDQNGREEPHSDFLSQQQKGLETRLTTPKPENYSFKKELINMITGEKTMFEVTSDNKLILLNDKAINDDRLKNITFSIDLPDDKTRFKFQVKEQTDKIVLVSLFNKLMLNFDQVEYKQQQDAVDGDDKFANYKKMLELQIPPLAINFAMKRNQCSDEDISNFFKIMNIDIAEEENLSTSKTTTVPILPPPPPPSAITSTSENNDTVDKINKPPSRPAPGPPGLKSASILPPPGIKPPGLKSTSSASSTRPSSKSVTTPSPPGLSAPPGIKKQPEKPEHICAACKKPILANPLFALGKYWHQDHFCCKTCGTKLEKYWEKDGIPYCKKHFHRLSLPICGSCLEPIEGQFMKAMGKFFHPNHFACCACNYKFKGTDKFSSRDGNPYCKDCWVNFFTPVCSLCNKHIEGQYLIAGGKKLHPQCFVCTTCKCPFVGGKYFNIGEKPYCEEHSKKAYQEQQLKLAAASAKALQEKLMQEAGIFTVQHDEETDSEIDSDTSDDEDEEGGNEMSNDF